MTTGCFISMKGRISIPALRILLAVGVVCSGMTLRSQNLVTNPGFESGTEDWYLNGGYLLTTNTTYRFSGVASGFADLQAFGSVLHSMLGVMPPGHTYGFSGRFRVDTGTRPLIISLVQVDAAGSRSTSITGNVTTTFAQLSGTFSLVATGALTALQLRFSTVLAGPGSGPIAFYIDDIVITNSSPSLTIARAVSAVSVSWPTSAASYNLQSTTNFPVINWRSLTNGLRTNAGSVIYTTAPSDKAFFRLMKP